MTKSLSASSSDFEWLCQAFNSYEWSYDDEAFEEDDISSTNFIKHDYEGVARDAFYSPQEIVSTMKDFVKEHGGAKMVKRLGLDEASVLFDCQVADTDDSGYSQTIVLGNLDKGWMMTLTGFLFEFNDENFDINATLALESNLAPDMARQKFLDIVRSDTTACINLFARQISQMKNSLPSQFHEDLQKIVETELLDTEMLRPVVVKKHKTELLDAIDDTNLSPSPKPKM